jgi:Na+-translocating ferredoxin:NAD+ oxidoreductase subunit D
MSEKIKPPENLTVTDPPHIKDGQSTKKIMWFVVLALLPSNIYSVYLTGIKSLSVIFVSVITSVAAEALFQYLLKKPVTIKDGSAVITGLLIAMNLPVDFPIPITAIASFFAIIVVKQLFGGLGFNIFNPALAALALITSIWPTEIMTKLGNITHVLGIEWPFFDILLKSAVTGNTTGFLGESSALLLLASAAFLLLKRIITWHIPAAFLGTVAVFMLLYYSISGFEYFTAYSFLQIFSGGLLICALFMATDMVTSPITGKGMIIFGIGCGILSSIIRLWADSGAVCYAILIMNAAVPIIDRYTKPRVFGK